MDKIELPLLKGNDRKKVIPYAMIIGIVILIICLILLILSLTFKSTIKIHYSDSSNLDYKVYLKENDYYESEYLGKDKQYISSLIDYISTDYTYSFTTEEDVDLSYSYYVMATLSIANSNGKEIFTKDEKLIDDTEIAQSNNIFKINQNVKIDYQSYNKLAKEFIDEYGITSEATLNVSLIVNVTGTVNGYDKNISENKVITLEIPLTQKTVDISMNYTLSNNKDATIQYQETNIDNKPMFALSVFAICIDILTIIGIILVHNRTKNEYEKYHDTLNKILRDNDRYISETFITERVEDMLKTRSLRIEIVKSFTNLMDIRDSLGTPILYHEERPGEEAVFYIITDRIGYIYVMNIDEFKKKKNKK